MTYAVFIKDGDIGRTTSNIDHSHTFISFVFGGNRFGRSNCIEEKSRLTDLHLLQRPFHTTNRTVIAQNEIKYRLKLIAERSDRIGRLFAINNIALGDNLNNGFTIGSLYIVHALMEFLHILFANFAVTTDKNVIGIFNTTNMLS